MESLQLPPTYVDTRVWDSYMFINIDNNIKTYETHAYFTRIRIAHNITRYVEDTRVSYSHMCIWMDHNITTYVDTRESYVYPYSVYIHTHTIER